MAHFFFDLHQCGNITVDEEGHDVGDLVAARAHAIHCARDVMVGELREGRLCLGCAIVIRDRVGATVMAVPFNEAVAVTHIAGC